jgi:hypothetical protein
MMKHILVLVAIAALAVFNGIFSPHSFVVFALQGIWYPAFLPSPLNVMFILSGVISALAHFFVTGVPAAVLEKLFAPKRIVTSVIWLGAMLLPTFQTVRHLGWI